MRRPKFVGFVLCVLAVGLLPGCGTVFFMFLPRGVKVDSVPQGATVWVDNEAHEAVTPTKIGVWPQEDHVVSAKITTQEGVELKGQTTLTRGVRIGVIVFDALLTGGLGIFVDWFTGALYHFRQRTVVLNLGSHERAQDELRGDREADRSSSRDERSTSWKDRRPPRDYRTSPREERWEESETARPLLEDDEPAPHVRKGTPPSEIDEEQTQDVLEPAPIDPAAAPCRVCGEPRGDAVPCPSCGMD